MDNDKRLPPDVEQDWDEAKDEIKDEARNVAGRVSAKASELADKTGEKLRNGYESAKESLADLDARETMRDAGRYVQETGEAAVRTVERHPLAAFSLGALAVGLVAWATMRRPSHDWSRDWQPDMRRLRRALPDYSTDDIAEAGRGLLDSGRDYLSSAGSYLSNARDRLGLGQARDYARDYLDNGTDYLKAGRDLARDGGRILVKRTEREPVAALLAAGLAVYLVGTLLSSQSSSAPPAKRRGGRR